MVDALTIVRRSITRKKFPDRDETARSQQWVYQSFGEKCCVFMGIAGSFCNFQVNVRKSVAAWDSARL